MTRACPLCGHDQTSPYRRLDRIEIVRCRRCGMLFRPEVPAELAAWYDETYFRSKQEADIPWGGSGDYVADQDRHIQVFDRHIAELERWRRPARLLDVGCATGFLLEAAKRRGWQVTGLDISEFAASYAKREFGIDVKVGLVETIQIPPASFDVITAFEYIEHVIDPVSTLRAVRPWLKPDGLLVLATPNAGSRAARRHPERFDGFMEWRHLTYFTRDTMRRLLESAGYAPVDIQTDLNVASAHTFAPLGVARPDRLRALVNRTVPGFKTAIRRLAGRCIGGPTMKVYARPI